MGLISPEGSGLHLPGAPKGIERTPVPEGFEWHNGVLRIVEKPKEGLVKPTDADIASTRAGRAEMDAEAKEAAQRPWKELGIGKSAFLMPNQFDFLALALKACGARSGAKAPFSTDDLQAYLTGECSRDRLGRKVAKAERQEAAAGFSASLAQLYSAWRDEFRASPQAQEAFFTGAFFTEKLSPEGGKPANEMLDLLLTEFPSLDRNRPSYVIAKSMLHMHVDHLTVDAAASLAGILKRNNDCYTDLGFALYGKHPRAFAGMGSMGEKTLSLPASELAANAEQYASRAFNELPVLTPKVGSKVGYEIEVLLESTDASLKRGLSKEAHTLSVVDKKSGSLDGGGMVFEFRTKDGGMEYTKQSVDDLIRLGAVLTRSRHAVALASVHVNLDSPPGTDGRIDTPFFFRSAEETRMEMQKLAKPVPRIDTPFVNEMSVLVDQTEVLRALYEIPTAEAEKSFLIRRFSEGLPTVKEYFAMDAGKINLEFLIELAQQNKRADMVPALLRLYARSALPATVFAINLEERVFEKDSLPYKEKIPFTRRVRQAIENDTLQYDYRTNLAQAVTLSMREFKNFWETTDVGEHLIRKVVQGVELPETQDAAIEEIMSIADAMEVSDDHYSIKEIILKLGQISYTPTVERLLSIPGNFVAQRMIASQVTPDSFQTIESLLRNPETDHVVKQRLIAATPEQEITPRIQAFLETLPTNVEHGSVTDVRTMILNAKGAPEQEAA